MTDQQALDARWILAPQEGLFVEPASATAPAGVLGDLERGKLSTDDDVVVILFGTGRKDAVSAAGLGEGNRPRHINADDIQSVLAEPGASP